MNLTRRVSVAAALGLVLVATAHGRAWEIDKPGNADTRSLQTPAHPFPFQMTFSGGRDGIAVMPTRFGSSGEGQNDPFFAQGQLRDYYAKYSANGLFRFETRYIHEALGGAQSAADHSQFAASLLFCPTKPTDSNFEAYGCRVADITDNAPPGWATARKRWVDNDDEKVEDEHAELTRQAALVAGLPQVLNETFWVRYPAPNGYITSPIDNPQGAVPGSGWLVGPRWRPEGIENVATSTLRPIRLYELSQTPDLALSLWDWAASQELCPLDSAPGFPVVNDDPGNTRCHDYMTTIGPLNATHFAPANKNVYAYYHDLALKDMARCNTLSAALAPNYVYNDYNGGWAPVLSKNDTEVHECEREAFVYEMFAQHFLQDAWSSGHMWHRWGYTEPSAFPYYLKDAHGIHWDDMASIPDQNIAGRRALIAGVTASFVGMIHGVKSIARYALPQSKGVLGDIAVWAGLTDDPLCAPNYFDLSVGHAMNVLWSDSSNQSFKGLGDLFATALLPGGDPGFSDQADRLRMCTAKSLRDVYDAGPHAHGAPGAFTGRWSLDNFDMEAECWSQRATNSSMVGAVLPAPLAYGLPGTVAHDIGVSLFGTANDAVLDKFQATSAWTLPDVPDRDRFLAALRSRMIMDELSVADAYLDNAMTNPTGDYQTSREPFGTQSARGDRKAVYEDSHQITFLGVPPNQALFDTPPVKFMDSPDAIAVPELANSSTDGPSGQLVRQMFWRAHPEDTCEVPGLVNELRDECLAGAELPGGNPEACTRCAEVAELQMPTCAVLSTNTDFIPSKCSSMGYENLGGIDPLYYVPFRAGQPSCFDLPTALVPPYFAAFHYCTGTEPLTSYGSTKADAAQLFGSHDISTQIDHVFECSQFDDWLTEHIADGDIDLISHYEFGKVRSRVAHGIGESALDANSWLSPVVTAQIEETTTQVLDEHNWCMQQNPNSQLRITTSFDAKVAGLIAPLPLWDNEGSGLRAFSTDEWSPQNHPVEFEFCGVTQRATYANRDCSEVLPLLGEGLGEVNSIGLPQNVLTGFEANTATANQEVRCSVIEDRRLKSSCIDGTCSANGLCTALPPPDMAFAH